MALKAGNVREGRTVADRYDDVNIEGVVLE